MSTAPLSSAEPMPADRAATVILGVWALVPGGLSLYFQSRMLPGEQWGLGFLFLILVPAWFACGLMLALVRSSAPGRRRRVAGAFLASTALGLAGLLVAARVSPLLLLHGPVAAAFARLDPPSGTASVVEIEWDRSLTGYGRFVLEDPTRSTAAAGALTLGDGSGEDPSEGVLLLERRPTYTVGEGPPGVDAVIALPVRDGWWYLHTDH